MALVESCMDECRQVHVIGDRPSPLSGWNAGDAMSAVNLDEMIVFMAVADAGGFAAGGRAKGITRSAAAKAVARLEERLGVRLLNRTTRGMSLTEEGRILYAHGTKIVAALEEAEASVARSDGMPRGTLRLTAPDAFGRAVVLPLLCKFLAQWPQLKAEVSLTDRVVDLVDEGFDLAVRMGAALSDDNRLIARVVGRLDVDLVASPSYLADCGEPSYPADLEHHQCVFFKTRGSKQKWRIRTSEGSWIEPQLRGRLSIDSGHAIRDAALAGVGVASLPRFLVEPDISTGRLTRVLPEVEHRQADVAVVYPSRRLLEPRVRLFINALADLLKTSSWETPVPLTSRDNA
jgi:DNA-binding transcriptional LysR family regulator